jgi:hypothetical protein
MTETKSQARADRLKAALRENLKRRKVQTRGREGNKRSEPGQDAEGPASGKRIED